MVGEELEDCIDWCLKEDPEATYEDCFNACLNELLGEEDEDEVIE